MQAESIRAEKSERSSFKSLLVFLLLFFAVWALRATVLFFIDERIHSQVLSAVYSNVVKFLLWVIPAVVYLRVVDRKPALAYLKLTAPINTRGLGYAVLLSAFYFAATILFETGVGGKNLHDLYAASLIEWLTATAFIFFSPISEEILFRGFVLHQFADRLRFLAANLITATLFTLIHWPFWVWRNGFHLAILQNSAGILLLAILLGYAVKLTNSLWPAVAIHIANNLLAHFLHT
ncbi:MAG: CPBP family intramembrane glutamic endopeptidase [Blastocatellia bacterium]